MFVALLFFLFNTIRGVELLPKVGQHIQEASIRLISIHASEASRIHEIRLKQSYRSWPAGERNGALFWFTNVEIFALWQGLEIRETLILVALRFTRLVLWLVYYSLRTRRLQNALISMLLLPLMWNLLLGHFMTLCEHLLLVLLTPRLSLALFLLESTTEFGHAMRCTG